MSVIFHRVSIAFVESALPATGNCFLLKSYPKIKPLVNLGVIIIHLSRRDIVVSPLLNRALMTAPGGSKKHLRWTLPNEPGYAFEISVKNVPAEYFFKKMHLSPCKPIKNEYN